MSRYLMVMWSGGGAVPPQLAIAKRLMRAGHDVSILAPRSLADVVAASGASFELYQRAAEHDLSDPDREHLRGLVEDALSDLSLNAAAERLATDMAGDDHDLAVRELEVLADPAVHSISS